MISRAPEHCCSGARSVLGRSLSLGTTLLALASGCRSAGDSGRFGRHLGGEVWTGGFREPFDHRSQWMPAAGFLLATPLVAIADDDLTEDSVEGFFTAGSTVSGNFLSIGLGATVIGLGAAEALVGDGGDSLEIGLESVGLTFAATQILKVTTRRERPSDGTKDSFPSGHTSFAFSAATYLARAIDDASDGSCDKLGYLFYIPAVYVGVNRVEGQRHWSSDVTFGAFLGIVVTNWVYNAHRDDGVGQERPTILPSRKKAVWRIAPVLDGSGIVVGLSVGF